MKKVINGKLYDSDTATEICEYSNGYYANDFRNYSKTLYKSPKGQYFFYYYGGPLSCMSVNCGSGKSGSANIALCTKEEAKEFAQENNVNVAIKEFGDIEQG